MWGKGRGQYYIDDDYIGLNVIAKYVPFNSIMDTFHSDISVIPNELGIAVTKWRSRECISVFVIQFRTPRRYFGSI